MQKALQVVALLGLLGLGAVATVVAVDPAGASRLVGVKLPTDGGGKSSAAKKGEFDRKSAAAKPAKPAAEPTKAGEAPARRPPKRSEVAATPAATAAPGATAAKPTTQTPVRKARFVGMRAPETITGEAPPVAMYPFRVLRQTEPDADSITVELGVQNFSGSQWKTAYIALKAPRMEQAALYDISDWQIDEIIALDYTFLKSSTQERMTELRIISVTGERRESALARRVGQRRREIIGGDDTTESRVRTGDRLTVTGLLAVLAKAQAPLTGTEIQVSLKREEDSAKPLEVKLDESLRLPPDLVLGVKETSAERKAAADLARTFHKAGASVEAGLDELAAALAKGPYREVMPNDGKKALAAIHERLETFNKLGVDLATLTQRSKDPEIRKAGSVLAGHSSRLVGQLDAVEKQIKAVDSSFTIRP